MKKQARQIIVLLIVLAVLGIGYAVLCDYNKEQQNQPAQSSQTALLDLNQEEIISIRYNYEGETYTFEKEDETWHSVSNPECALHQHNFYVMSSNLAKLEVEHSIGQVTDLSQYGLEKPQKEISFETADSSYTIFIGDYNEVAGGYYLYLEEDKTVHLVNGVFVNVFSKNLEDLMETVSENEV